MKYMGSKRRIAKDILPIILKFRQLEQWYVELFCGGCNMIDKVTGNRIANDVNEYLIELFRYLQKSSDFPFVDEVMYKQIQKNKDAYPKWIVGYVGFCCSYNGKWFGGYSCEINTKIGTKRNYQTETLNALLKQKHTLSMVAFYNKSYNELNLPSNSIIYCDPPYAGTTNYKDKFNHDSFWQWCRERVKDGNEVFVSEYNAPDDFVCIWQKELTSSLTLDTGSKKGIEKLFIHQSKYDKYHSDYLF